jgi:peptidoglycan hydrolase-like protein with peptidoglycan-binding domain
VALLSEMLDARAGVAEAFDSSKHARGAAGSGQGGRFIASGSNNSSTDVQHVQRAVGAKTTGKFDYSTRAAVRSFQQQHGLTVDGKVGHQTAAAIAGDRNASKVKTGSLTNHDVQRIRARGVKLAAPRRRASPPARAGGGVST